MARDPNVLWDELEALWSATKDPVESAGAGLFALHERLAGDEPTPGVECLFLGHDLGGKATATAYDYELHRIIVVVSTCRVCERQLKEQDKFELTHGLLEIHRSVEEKQILARLQKRMAARDRNLRRTTCPRPQADPPSPSSD